MLIHPSETRGKADHGWLKSRHTFSFADYFDPERLGFGVLRVINDDSIAPGMGFGTHPHRDMEIITIPTAGALAHKDSEGNSSIIRKGEVQIMSAGTGIRHSEFNASDSEQSELLQIWVHPKVNNVKPRYEQKAFTPESRQNQFSLVVSPDGREGSVVINQDAFFSLADMEEGVELTYQPKLPGNGAYLFILKGEINLNGTKLNPRDGVGIDDLSGLKLKALTQAEVLIMEIPLV